MHSIPHPLQPLHSKLSNLHLTLIYNPPRPIPNNPLCFLQYPSEFSYGVRTLALLLLNSQYPSESSYGVETFGHLRYLQANCS